MGKLIRCISEDGTLTVMAADTTDIVNRAQEIHGTSAVVSAALGRLLTAASLMGSALKGADDSVTLRIKRKRPCGHCARGVGQPRQRQRIRCELRC